MHPSYLVCVAAVADRVQDFVLLAYRQFSAEFHDNANHCGVSLGKLVGFKGVSKVTKVNKTGYMWTMNQGEGADTKVL